MVREGFLEEATSELRPEELQNKGLLGGVERDVSGTVWGNTYKGPEMKDSRMHWRREFPLSEKGRGQGDEMGLAVSRVQFEEENHGLKGSATICL